MKEWVRKNPEKAKANKRMTYIRYREKIIEGNKKWLKKNYKKNLEYRVAWERNKRKTNPQHRLNINFARAICHCLGSKKEWRKQQGLVDHTINDLVKHLEKQFDDKMNWDNYGSYWHIDHIKPISLFKYETAEDPEFKKCWALDNLQPLEKIANLKKGNKF